MSDNASKELLSNLSFCVFDLESTGGNHDSDKIIEIGMVQIDNLQITATKSFIINPEIKIPDFIQKLTSIKQKDVEDAPVIEDIIEEILEFMGDRVLVAHNTSFDIAFFNSVLKRMGKGPLENKNICTNIMTKNIIPNLLNSNLQYMSKVFGIELGRAHRALDDAKATAELLIKYLHIFIEKKISKVNHLYYPRNKFELDRANFKANVHKSAEVEEKIKKLKTPFLITVTGDDGIILYSFPCEPTKNVKDLIISKVHKIEWKSITIKLYGSLFEALINFKPHFAKLDLKLRNEVMSKMWKYYIGSPDKEDYRRCHDDFLVLKHLVPQQLIIFPLKLADHKQHLIFRYPAHGKKLLQYIKSKSKAKPQNQQVIPMWDNFFHAYLFLLKDSPNEAFIFKKTVIDSKDPDFDETLSFMAHRSEDKYNYPRQYI